MNYQLQYNYCAIFIYVVVLFSFVMRKKTKEFHNRMFIWMIITGMVGVIANTLGTAAKNGMFTLPMRMMLVCDNLHFISITLAPFEYAIYSVALTKDSLSNASRKFISVMFGPIILFGILVLLNPYYHALFEYQSGVYHRDSMQLVVYIICLYYAAFAVCYVYNERKSTNRHTKLSLLMLFLTGCFTGLVQLLFPEILCQHLGFAICEFITILNLQNISEDIDYEFNTYNRHCFERIFNKRLRSGDRYEMLFIQLEDLNFLVQTVGADVQKNILVLMAEFLNAIADGEVYHIKGNVFLIMTETDHPVNMDELVRKIETRFEQKWGSDGDGISINYKMLRVVMPDDITTLEQIYFCSGTLASMTPRDGHMVNIADVNFDKVGRRLLVENVIKRAIKEDNFQMYYQPIYSFEEKRFVAAEALIRLIDPEEGFIPPDEFIPIAEQNGTILKIGEIVFDKVFKFIHDNEMKKLGVDYIEINLSVIQCMQEELSNQINQLLQEHSVERSQINLEITETAAVDSPKVLLKNMNDLFRDGITFSLDDFGTGYSNINSLMSMPLDIIKFDKSLIDMTAEDRGRDVIESSVAMVKRMGLMIVAEVVEEESQIAMLKDMGIDYLQGYYFSKPLPMGEYIEFVKRYNVACM